MDSSFPGFKAKAFVSPIALRVYLFLDIFPIFTLFTPQAVAIAPIQYVPVYYYYPVPILEDPSGDQKPLKDINNHSPGFQNYETTS